MGLEDKKFKNIFIENRFFFLYYTLIMVSLTYEFPESSLPHIKPNLQSFIFSVIRNQTDQLKQTHKSE